MGMKPRKTLGPMGLLQYIVDDHNLEAADTQISIDEVCISRGSIQVGDEFPYQRFKSKP